MNILKPNTLTDIFRILDHISPTPCDLHFDARDIRPVNYPIWKKTPKIIKKMLHGISQYPGTNLDGILFFNEANVSKANRQAVYEALRKDFAE